MITHTPLAVSNLPIKTLVARQWPTNLIHISLMYAEVPSILTTNQPNDLQTTIPPVLSPIPEAEDPVATSEVNFQIIVAVVAIAMAILLIMVVVAMVILVVIVRKARLSKRVVMHAGSTSPIDNPSYVIGMYT